MKKYRYIFRWKDMEPIITVVGDDATEVFKAAIELWLFDMVRNNFKQAVGIMKNHGAQIMDMETDTEVDLEILSMKENQ